MAGERLIRIGTVTTELERELVRSALESYGIEVLFRSSLPSSVYPGLMPIKVLVPEKDAEVAKAFFLRPCRLQRPPMSQVISFRVPA